MFEVYNAGGKLQTTSEQVYNLFLTATKTLTNSTATAIDLTELYALQPAVNDSQGITHSFFTSHGLVATGAIGSKVHFFDYKASKAQQGEYGLEVYDETGAITYSSRYKSINVIDHITVNAHSSQKNGRKSYGTTNLAVIPNKIPFIIELGGAANLAFFITTVWSIDQGDLCWQTKAIGTAPPFQDFESSSEIDFLVIDTSHF